MDDAFPIQRTLGEILAPYRTAAISEAAGGVDRRTVAQWRNGKSLPELHRLPGIAKLTGTDLGVLTQILAAQADGKKAVA